MNIQNRICSENILNDNTPDVFPLHNHKRLKSFIYAGRGIVYFFRNEFHARVHFLAAFIVVILCILLPVSRTELALLVFSISIVWITEMINTAIEKCMDFISLEQHEAIRIVKDIAAGAVLIASFTALITGAIIFIPKIFHI